MTLDQLRIFVAVAERLHVTQAAAALNMTQSAASAAIAALETGLATKLFDRVGRGIALTEAGRLLLPEAKAVLTRLAQAEQALDDLQGLRRGHLNLHASQTIAGYWLPPLMHRFRAVWPQVTLSLVIGNSAQVARAVLEGDADLGFVEGDVDDALLARIAVATDRLVLVVGAGHPWAARAQLGGGRPDRDGLGAARARVGHAAGFRARAGRIGNRSGPARCADGIAVERGGARGGGGGRRGDRHFAAGGGGGHRGGLAGGTAADIRRTLLHRAAPRRPPPFTGGGGPAGADPGHGAGLSGAGRAVPGAREAPVLMPLSFLIIP